VANCEDLWVEIEAKTTNIILAVIYRHSKKHISDFQEKLCNNLAELENEKLQYIVSGDMNINTLMRNDAKITDYINNLTAIGCKLMIDNHTSFAKNCNPSLLDHIYTNISKGETHSGVSLFELSDHLPTFFITKQSKCIQKTIAKLKRCLKNFCFENFLTDLNDNLSKIEIDSTKTNVNSDVVKVSSMFKSILDKHAPLRPMSRKEKNFASKPWIT